MLRSGWVAGALAVALATSMLAGCRTADAPLVTPIGVVSGRAPDARAPDAGRERPAQSVTVADFDLEDPSRPRQIPVRVAFPSGSARALPVVIFSHGAYSSKDDYAPVTDSWAARGYVVIAVTHPDSVSLGAVRGKPTPGAWAGRTADVRFILDHLNAVEEAIPPLRGRIDRGRIALAGHSLGGMVAQAFGGMTGTNVETNERYALRDSRIRAVVLLSGVGPLPPATNSEDFVGLTLPLFVSVGTDDLAMPQRVPKSGLDLRREPFDLAHSAHKYLLVLDGADHYLGGMVGRDDLPKSPNGTAYVAAFDELSGLFLDAWLKEDSQARARLDALAIRGAYTGVARFERG